VIELAEADLEVLPVDQPGELHQRMAQIDLLAETGTPEVIGRLWTDLLRPHRIACLKLCQL
jgi:hypothetical protein